VADDRVPTGADPAVARDSLGTALRVIAALLLVGACWMLAKILVPLVLALMLAVALSPVADWLERHRLPKAVAAFFCTLAVAVVISAAVGLVVIEAGSMVRDSDRYIKEFSETFDKLTKRAHAGGLASSLGVLETAAPKDGPTADKGGETSAGAPGPARDDQGKSTGSPSEWADFLRQGLSTLGGWLVSGVGGLLGVVGGGVLFLAFLFYMLQGRRGWMDRIAEAGRRLGMAPRDGALEKVRHEVILYFGCVGGVACAYAVIVSLALWGIGVPQPLLWGLLAGMLEFVPYFGALIASVLPTLVALSLGTWWQPAAAAGTFLTLHLVEGYMIAPTLYGKAVKLDPVTILFGALFFGALWGPIGLAIATPMMIVLRGLVAISPDTPALDALTEVDKDTDLKAPPDAKAPAVAPNLNAKGRRDQRRGR